MHCHGVQHVFIPVRNYYSHCSRTNWKDYLCNWNLGGQRELIPLNEETSLRRSCSHLFGDGGDEGGWSGRGNEGEGMPSRAGGVGGRAQRQPRCDAKQDQKKREKRKEALEI